MRLTVKHASQGLRGTLQVPGDKSISHRALLLGAIARGRTEITGFLPSADCLRTLRIIRALGAKVSGDPTGRLTVMGKGPEAFREPDNVLYAGNSGTTTRLVLGVLAGLPFHSVLTGDASLRKRPMNRVVHPLTEMGATFLGRAGSSRLPLGVTGRHPLSPLRYHLPVPSAQVKSAILLAGLRADGETVVSEDIQSRNHTEEMLTAFGVPVIVDGGAVKVKPVPLTGIPLSVPGDISSAAFFLVAAACVPGSEILIRHVGVNVTRTGILDVLKQMGASISIVEKGVSGGEAWADLIIKSSGLSGVEVPATMAPRLIDEVPILAVAACAASGETVFHGVGELRVKESDRLAVIVEEFRKMGAELEAGPDFLRVHGNAKLTGAAVRSHGDHRIAMSLAVAGLMAQGETAVSGAECIATSFPDFMGLLSGLSTDDLLSL